MMKKGSIKSRRGVSLVEEVCAVAVLVIAVLGLLVTIGFSHTSIFGNNSHEVAAAQVQKISDRLMAKLATEPSAAGDVLNDADIHFHRYGDPELYSNGIKQYSYTKAITTDNVTRQQSTGYDISVLVYYSKTNYVLYNSYVSYTGKDV